MAQLNYDLAPGAGGTAQSGAPNPNTHVATRSTGALTLSGRVAISLDNTLTKDQVLQGLKAAMRILQRDLQGVVTPSDLATSGTKTD